MCACLCSWYTFSLRWVFLRWVKCQHEPQKEFEWKLNYLTPRLLQILVWASCALTRGVMKCIYCCWRIYFREKKKPDLQFISLSSICLLYPPVTAWVTDGGWVDFLATDRHNVAAASPCNDKQIGSVDWPRWEKAPPHYPTASWPSDHIREYVHDWTCPSISLATLQIAAMGSLGLDTASH